MCICINCRHVHTCTTYRLIEQQHKKPSGYQSGTFIPNNTIIQINIKPSSNHTEFEWDLQECLSFVEKPGYWLM